MVLFKLFSVPDRMTFLVYFAAYMNTRLKENRDYHLAAGNIMASLFTAGSWRSASLHYQSRFTPRYGYTWNSKWGNSGVSS